MIGNQIAKYPIAGGVSQIAIKDESDILFNGVNLLDCENGTYVDETNWDDINQINLVTYDAPQTDGGGFLSNFTRGKTINMRLALKADNLEDLNNEIGLLRKRLAVRDSVLKYKVNGEYREGIVNLENLSFNRDYTNDEVQGNIQMTFRAMNFFKSTETVDATENVITNSRPFDVENVGEVRCDYTLHLVFGVGNVGVDTISVEKDGFTMAISQACNDGDILSIDGPEKEIVYNGVPTIDYTGPFTPLNIGSNPFTLNINGIVNVDVTYVFNINYR